MLDHPNSRSSHKSPTPRGGGLVFVSITLTYSLIAFLDTKGFTIASLPLLAAPLSIVGLVDDRYNLPASWRYGVQLLTAVLILYFSPIVNQLLLINGAGSVLFIVSSVLLSIAITAIINFTNFMDGLDGLVSGCMAIAISALILMNTDTSFLWVLVGPFSHSCSGIGVLQRFLWVMWVVPFLAQYSLVLCLMHVAGQRQLDVSFWQLHCSLMLAFVYFVA